MRKMVSLLILLCVVNFCQAQTEEEMLHWLKDHVSSIDMENSSGKNNKYNGLKILEFTKAGVEARGPSEYSNRDYILRLYFDAATIENDLLVLKDRKDNYIKLRIIDASIRQQYKDVFARYAYSLLNTVEADLPVYESEKVDKAAVISEDPDGWKNFMIRKLIFDPAYKHETPPGDYMAEIQFVVTQDGRLKDFRKSGNNPKGIHEMMLYLMTRSAPWIPAKVNGINVSTYVKIKQKINIRKLGDDDEMAAVFYQNYKDLNYNMAGYETGSPSIQGSQPVVISKKPMTMTLPTSQNKADVDLDKMVVVNDEKWITEPVAKFYSIGSFNKGLALVSTDGFTVEKKYGFINKAGKVVVPLKYDLASGFTNELAMVNIKEKYGFIDTTGKLVIPMVWDRANGFSDDVAVVKKGDQYGCIDTKGEIVIPITLFNLHDFREGLAAVQNDKGKWGYINKAGKIVIETKYEWPEYFSDGMVKTKLDGKYGYLDRNGNEAIPIIYDEATNFSEGLVSVKTNGKYGFINKKGETIIPFKYDYAYSFEDGLSLVKMDRKCGMINKQGEVVIPIIYEELTNFIEGVARVKINGKYGFIDAKGILVIKATYDATGFSRGGLIATSTNDRWLYIDRNGYTKINVQYDKANDFVGGLAEVELNGKTFIIDRTGKKWMPPKK